MAMRIFRNAASRTPTQLKSARKQHVGSGGTTIEGLCVGFTEKRRIQDKYEPGRSPVILVLNLENVPRSTIVRDVPDIDPGDAIEIQTRVTTWSKKHPKGDPRVEQYCAKHIAAVQTDEYTGNFPVAHYYDAAAKKLHDNVYELLEYGTLIECKMWKNDAVDTNIKQGDIIRVTGVSAQRCLSMPTPKGAAVAKEKEEEARAELERLKQAQANGAAAVADDVDNVQVADDGTVVIVDANDGADANGANATDANGTTTTTTNARIPEPGMFELSLNSWYGQATVSPDSGEGSLLDKMAHYFPHVMHAIRLPNGAHDNYTMVLYVNNFQSTDDEMTRLAPGPSVIRVVDIPVKQDLYEKAPAGKKLEDTTEREMYLTRHINQSQYVEDFNAEAEEGTCKPFQVEIKAYQDQIRSLGITRHDDWKRFGWFPWEGVAITQCDAKRTTLNAINQGNEADNYGLSGFVETYLKLMVWDVPKTLLKHWVEVDGEFLEDLYADVWKTAKDRSGNEIVILSLNELGTRSGVGGNPAHVAGLDSTFINLNEWNNDAGKISREFRIFALPSAPITPELVNEFKHALHLQQANGNSEDSAEQDIDDLSHQHRLDVVNVLRSMPLNDRRDILLGRVGVSDFVLYNDQEIEALASLSKEDAAPVLRGEAGLEGVKQAGAHMLVYAIRRNVADAALERWKQEDPVFAQAYAESLQLYEEAAEGAFGEDVVEVVDAEGASGGEGDDDVVEEVEDTPAPAPTKVVKRTPASSTRAGAPRAKSKATATKIVRKKR